MLIWTAGAFFTTYEGVKSIFKKANPTLSASSRSLVPQPFIDSAASAIAELVSCSILTLAEGFKQNCQMIRWPEIRVRKVPLLFSHQEFWKLSDTSESPTSYGEVTPR